MRSLKRQGGFWNFVIPAAAAVLGNVLTNDANKDIAEDTNYANAEQAHLNRQFNAQQAEIGRDWSSDEAVKNRTFQTDMSNTVWQRGVRDMQAAGLNPMLAYSQGGASSPAGNMPSSGVASGSAATMISRPYTSPISGAVSAYMATLQAKQLEAQTKNVEADTRVKEATIPKIGEETGVATATRAHLYTSIDKMVEESKRIIEEVKQIALQHKLTERQTQLVAEQVLNAFDTGGKIRAETGNILVDTKLRELEIPHMKNMSESEESWWKKNVSPYLRDLFGGRGISPGVSIRR